MDKDPQPHTVFIPLSLLDHCGTHHLDITLGYVLQRGPFDTSSLEDAASRLVERWRLLAGHIEWQSPSWCIRVPLGKIQPKDHINLTRDSHLIPLDTPVISSSLSATVVSRPELKFFRHSSVPSSLSAYSKSKWLLSIHVTEFTNCICVGISVPHVIFDIFGFGQIVRGLDAELNGREWVPPPLFIENIMKDALDDLVVGRNVPAQDTSITEKALANLHRHLVPAKFINIAWALGCAAYEYFRHEVNTRAVFLESKMLDDIVTKVKEEAKQLGNGWVSTGDILVAWALKAAHLNENDDTKVSVVSAVSIRSVFEEKDPRFNVYTHNSLILASYPLLSKQDISTKSLAELAIISRQSIDAVRNTSFIQSFIRWVKSNGGGFVLALRNHQSSWGFSNHVIGRLDDIDFGLEKQGIWFWSPPFLPDHTVVINKFKGGYLLQGNLRKSRWES